MKNFISIAAIILFWSCANVMAPTGGPKDVEPPALLSTIPKQGQTNFHGTRIMLEFNEFLKLKNPKEEIIITPAIKDVNITSKKNIVTIDFKEPLEENTTYNFSFRESIQDLNEGNPAEDLNLAFSTGDEIDSLYLAGVVTQLLKNQPAEKYTVAIYKQDTFDIFKHKPAYFTRTNKQGEFKIRNLKPGDYQIYAFEDKNKNLLLESKSEKFGIRNKKVILDKNIDSISINTIALDSRPITITGIRALGHFTKIRLNKNLVTYKLISQDTNDRNIKNCFATTQSEIDIFPNKDATDSTLVQFIGTDSLEQKIDTSFYIKQTNAKSLKEKIKLSVIKSQFTEDTQKFYSEVKSTELINSILYDSIFILADSIRKISFNSNEVRFDTIFRKLTFEKTFNRKDSIQWKKSKFVLGATAIQSIHGDSSKASINTISIISTEETATLILESNETKPNCLIEILDEKLNSVGIYPHQKTLVIKNIKPGSVSIRRITDQNGNGKWDPGNPNLQILPEEITFYIKPDGKTQIPLRANWEVNETWNF